MTEFQWTQVRPTQSGWYFAVDGSEIEIVYLSVDKNNKVSIVDSELSWGPEDFSHWSAASIKLPPLPMTPETLL